MRKYPNFLILIFLFMGCNFAPGSYPYAEKYKISVSESEFLTTIGEFKQQNPQYALPKHLHLKDGSDGESDYWYHIYFYYPKEDQIIFTWTRPDTDDSSKITFAFVGINQGLQLGHSKLINRDFSKEENRETLLKFEKRILNELTKNNSPDR